MANWWDPYRNSEGFKEALAKFGLTIGGMDQNPTTANSRANNQNDPLYWLKRTLEIYREMDQGVYYIPVVEPLLNGMDRQGHLIAGRQERFPTNIFVRAGDRLTIKWFDKPEEASCAVAVGTDFIGDVDDVDESDSKKLENQETIFEPKKDGRLLLSCVDNSDKRKPKHVGEKVRIEVSGGSNDYPIYIFGITPASDWPNISKNPNPYNQVQMFNGRVRVYATGDRAANSSNIDVNELMQQLLLIPTLYDQVNGLDNSGFLHSPSQGLQILVFAHGHQGAGGYAKPNLVEVNLYHPDKIEANTDFGSWHELGHQYQQLWSWTNLTEITVNIYALAACRLFKGKNANFNKECFYTLGDVTWDAETVQNFMSRKDNLSFDEMSKASKRGQHSKYDYALLRMFIQLGSSYGDNFYPQLGKLFREDYNYMDNQAKFYPDEKAKDWFVVNASRVAGQDLRGFFDQWGLGYSQTARNEIEALRLPSLDGGITIPSGTESRPAGSETSVGTGVTNKELVKELNINYRSDDSISIQIDTERKEERSNYIFDKNIGLVVEPPAEGPREYTNSQGLSSSYNTLRVELKNGQGSNFWIKLRGVKTSGCSDSSEKVLPINSFYNCTDYINYLNANSPNDWKIGFYLEDNPNLPEGRYTGRLNLMAKSETGDWLQPIKVNINYN